MKIKLYYKPKCDKCKGKGYFKDKRESFKDVKHPCPKCKWLGCTNEIMEFQWNDEEGEYIYKENDLRYYTFAKNSITDIDLSYRIDLYERERPFAVAEWVNEVLDTINSQYFEFIEEVNCPKCKGEYIKKIDKVLSEFPIKLVESHWVCEHCEGGKIEKVTFKGEFNPNE